MIGFIVSTLLFVAVCGFAVRVQKEGKPRRVPVPPPGTLGLYELAYLAGGPARAADVALLAARARGGIGIAANGQVAVQHAETPDAVAADVLAAVQSTGPGPGAVPGAVPGPGADLASARTAVAARPFVRAARERVFDLGLVNPSARNPRLRPARVALWIVPLVAIAGLFLEPYAGSPGDGVWIANLVLVVVGTAAGIGSAYLLFSRYDKLRAPLTDSAIHYLWSQVRDEQGLATLAAAVPGGAGLGPVALAGPAAGGDPSTAAAFGHAAQATIGRILGDGWTEQQWTTNATVQGPLIGPSYLDLHRQASNPAAAAPGQVPQAPSAPGANLGFQVPSQGGHGAPQPYGPYSGGPPVWENAPGATGGPEGGGEQP
ncbi:TIGR04222 domain-containing membrane protein [Yinghuangia sp. YIM S09857]|uniref:TIGR04222 domain-containing membrane protein n=1 Tax=Yinghuangia sp. YIM S09857 TaxID=3436929 RepID=UPI003F534AB5